MKLKVLNVAFPFAPVGTDAVGGAEQIVARLDDGIVRAGHKSFVIACSGSRTRGTLITTPTVPERLTPETQHHIWQQVRLTIEETLSRLEPDLIHFHGLDFNQYFSGYPLPALVTLHLPWSYYDANVFRQPPPNCRYICVSETQRASCPDTSNVVAMIPNGVPIPVSEATRKDDYVVCLSRIAPEKNIHAALLAAKSAGVACVLAGKVFPYPDHIHYFEESVRPLLDEQRRFVGSVDEIGKWRLLKAARCLLQPSLAEETSSLVAMESLACSTPVVAFRVGALPEIIDDGKTGYLVNSTAEMSRAIEFCAQLNPNDCLAAAMERFSADRMVAQ
ncbi:MAG: glycosyltransferase, partial [Verrucomicrobia bacterium]|nr:glycosyltransferase [Verrucomicrobiota bacterium]